VEQVRELLFLWLVNSLHVLVPKRRGQGFLRQPYGHHIDMDLNRIGELAEADVFGLDGDLQFDWGPHRRLSQANKDAATAVIMPALAAHYGVPYREALPNEFWAKHPCKPSLEKEPS
jgi:hypothetical protein